MSNNNAEQPFNSNQTAEGPAERRGVFVRTVAAGAMVLGLLAATETLDDVVEPALDHAIPDGIIDTNYDPMS